MQCFRPELTVPLFLGACAVFLAYVSHKHAVSKHYYSGNYYAVPPPSSPNYLRIFVVVFALAFGVTYFVRRNQRVSAKGMMRGGGGGDNYGGRGGDNYGGGEGGGDYSLDDLIKEIDGSEF